MKKLFLLFLLSPFFLQAQNKVGIGTTTPQATLDITNIGIGAELLRLSTDRPWVFKQGNSGISTDLILQSTVNDKGFIILSEDGLNRAAEFFSNNVHSNVLLVPDGGEVGVGLDDPMARLHISHNSNTLLPQLRLTETQYDYARIKMENTANPGTFWDIAGRSDSLAANGQLNFYYSSPDGTGDRMTILGNGNVGIGTTSPGAKLDIVGGDWNLGAGNPGDLRIGNSAFNFRIGVATGGGGAGTARLFSQGGYLLLGTNNSTHLSITTSGNVGIGETNPGNKLRVTGDPASTAHIFSAGSSYSGNVNIRAVEGFAVPASGYGYGGYLIGGRNGLYASGNGGNYTGTVFGVQGVATGSSGTRIGVYGTATGGTTNWAGYFSSGHVYVTNELRIGSGALGGATGYKLAVDGKVIAEEMRVQISNNWPDYVFADRYELASLEQLQLYIHENRHLPGVPSAEKVKAEGIEVGEMNRILLEKIEELTLHVLNLNKRIAELESK